MFTGSIGNTVISRYDLNENDVFEKTGEVSLENAGVTVGFQSTFFVSDTVAYTFDPNNFKAIQWNPETMTITGSTLEYFPEQLSTGTLEWATSASMQQAGDFIFDVRRVSDTEIGDYVPGLEIVVFDTRDESFSYEYTDRCGGFAGYAETANGDVYFTSNNVTAAAYRLQLGSTLLPCIVRMKAGEKTIDPDYNLEFHTLLKDELDNGAHPLSGETTAALIPSVGNSGITLGFDEDIVPVQDDTYCTANTSTQEDYDACLWNSGTMQRQQAWVFYHIDDLGAETPTVKKIEGMQPSGGANFNFIVDDRAFVLAFTADFSGSTFFDVTDPENVIEAMTVTGGFITGLARVR